MRYIYIIYGCIYFVLRIIFILDGCGYFVNITTILLLFGTTTIYTFMWYFAVVYR